MHDNPCAHIIVLLVSPLWLLHALELHSFPREVIKGADKAVPPAQTLSDLRLPCAQDVIQGVAGGGVISGTAHGVQYVLRRRRLAK